MDAIALAGSLTLRAEWLAPALARGPAPELVSARAGRRRDRRRRPDRESARQHRARRLRCCKILCRDRRPFLLREPVS